MPGIAREFFGILLIESIPVPVFDFLPGKKETATLGNGTRVFTHTAPVLHPVKAFRLIVREVFRRDATDASGNNNGRRTLTGEGVADRMFRFHGEQRKEICGNVQALFSEFLLSSFTTYANGNFSSILSAR